MIFYQPYLRAKEFSRETILVPSLRQDTLLSTFKILIRPQNIMCLMAGIMLKNISVRQSHATVIRNLGRLPFLRETSANVLKLDALK